MQFKHPELLYALFLLLIPIIVHLFQLRRFQKVDFTNVQFLKTVIVQTRKSSQLKKWLTLITRLLLLAAIIFAFAQPYFSKANVLNTDVETVIYLDNSFSMQAKGNKGELLNRAVQDLITTVDDKNDITIFTNTETYRNTKITAIKNDLLQLDYTANQLEYNAVLLKAKQLFTKNTESVKNLILISDFQQKNTPLKIAKDSLRNLFLIQLKPTNTNNIGIDSVYISKVNTATLDVSVKLNTSNNEIPISLFEDDKLLAKTSTTNNTAVFSIPNSTKINAKVLVEDTNLQFDNTLFFNINDQEKINVLTVSTTGKTDFLKRVYASNEFNYNAVSLNTLNYNDISAQNLIVLNELESIPTALINALNSFKSNGGNLLLIPAITSNIGTYNQLLNSTQLQHANFSEKKITTINYSHPIFNNVFDKQVSNFQYPKVNQYYGVNSNSGAILNYEDGTPFLLQSNHTFTFTAALNEKNSNFINSPLIVPTLYNIGRQSLQLPRLYYTIAKENTFDINTVMLQDDILKFKTNTLDIIPQQQTFPTKVTVTTNETPHIAATYAVANNQETLEHISYNYDRQESNLIYSDLSNITNVTVSDSVPELINNLKSDLNINALWKWFIIFALILLIIEMLILKYFK